MGKLIKKKKRILDRSTKKRLVSKRTKKHLVTRRISFCEESNIHCIQYEETQGKLIKNSYLTFGRGAQYDQENRHQESSFDSSIELSDRSLTPDDTDHWEGVVPTTGNVDGSLLMREIRRMRDGLKNKDWLTEFSCPHPDEEYVSPKRKRVAAKRVEPEWLGATVFPVMPYSGKRSKVCQKAKNRRSWKHRESYRSGELLRDKSTLDGRYRLSEPRVRRKCNRSGTKKANLQTLQSRSQEQYVNSEPDPPPTRTSNLRTVFRSICDTTIEPPENSPNRKDVEIINLLSPEPNPNPRS